MMGNPATNGEVTHTLSVYVANQPGVLVRVAQVFARRAFNIDSLVVSAGNDGEFSRMTITAQGAADALTNIIKSVQRLVDVIHVSEHDPATTIEKELALIKVKTDAKSRPEVLQVVEHFKGQTVDLTEGSLVIQVTGNSDKLDAMVEMLRRFGILEIVRTGKVLMARGEEET
ncbi:MAG: acetolactate synthase small subunit [Verrucomicrobia bacterium]|nr:acetolactate synthase small subunit [Verrucomicrobiota bacterium]